MSFAFFFHYLHVAMRVCSERSRSTDIVKGLLLSHQKNLLVISR